MKIVLKVTGNCSPNNKVKFIYSLSTFPNFGMDNQITRMFGNSLNSCLHNLFRSLYIGITNEKIMSFEEDERLHRREEGGDYGMVVVTICFHRKNGNVSYFCDIGTNDSNASVRTSNILPIFSKVVYGWALTLKHKQPPKGFEDAQRMQIRYAAPMNDNLADRFVRIIDGGKLCKINLAGGLSGEGEECQ